MTRKLKLKARAERMAETRERIARAAYELHSTIGPGLTTISAIAERAGVQRHTVYQHFPDEVALFGGCTEYGLRLDPLPDPDALAGIPGPQERLRVALAQQYAYYSRNETLLDNSIRDAPAFEQRLQAAGIKWETLPESVRAFDEQPGRLLEALILGWQVPDADASLLRAALGLAIDFWTWRTLTRVQGLSDEQAIELMVKFVLCLTMPGSSAGC